MYKTKKEIDAHVQDILSKTASEKEKNFRCFAAAKAYYSIREFQAAKRYLETYLNSGILDKADGWKLMGDILFDMGDKSKALDFFKLSYEASKSRVVLNRVCDLLHSGYGEESPESRSKYFSLQKSTLQYVDGLESEEDRILGRQAETFCTGCLGCNPDSFDFNKLNWRMIPTYAQQSMTPEELVAASELSTPAKSNEKGTGQKPTKSMAPRRKSDSKGSSPFPREGDKAKPPNPFASLSFAGEKTILGGMFTPEKTSTPEKTTPFSNPFESNAIQSATGFGELAKQGEISNAFSGSICKDFEGTGSPVFGKVQELTNTDSQVSSHEEVEEFVSSAEFRPVIPLPPLVEVKKGDEEETTFHEVRAKLYRFESATKEWKERGIGNIKILQNKSDPTKVRVVMWREQVQNVACNHRIMAGMSIGPHMNSLKALTWTAQDFAEETQSAEIFCCRFGSEKQCEDFKSHFQEMIDLVSSGAETGGAATATTTLPASPTMNGNDGQRLISFQKPPNSWECGRCYVVNDASVTNCISCGAEGPDAGDVGLSVLQK